MEKLEIKHSHVEVRGLKLHVAETGTGRIRNTISLRSFSESCNEDWFCFCVEDQVLRW